MQPALKTFSISPGIAFSYSFTFYQGSPGSTAPVDLTGANATLTIDDGAGTTLFTINSSGTQPNTGIYFGGPSNNPTNGIISILIDTTDIANFNWRYAHYVLSLTTQSLGTQDILTGTFAIVGFLP